MSDLLEIGLRKERLIARCAAQREQIAGAFHDLRRPFAFADRAVLIVRTVLRHPVLLGAVVAALVATRRRTLFGLVARGFAAWRLWRSANVWTQRFGVDRLWGRRREKAAHVPS